MNRKKGNLDYIQYEEIGASKQQRSRNHKGIVIVTALVFLLAIAANIIVWLWISRPLRDALDEEWNHCGRSSVEAQRRGCVMEPLFYGWMPKQCVYRKLTDQYPVFEDRKWFLKEDMIVGSTDSHSHSNKFWS